MAPSTPQDDGNSRATIAVLGNKIDNLTEEVRKLCASVDRRISYLEEKVDIRCGEVEGLTRTNAQDIRTNSKDIAVLDERLKTRTGVFGAVQAVAFALATALGVKF